MIVIDHDHNHVTRWGADVYGSKAGPIGRRYHYHFGIDPPRYPVPAVQYAATFALAGDKLMLCMWQRIGENSKRLLFAWY